MFKNETLVAVLLFTLSSPSFGATVTQTTGGSEDCNGYFNTSVDDTKSAAVKAKGQAAFDICERNQSKIGDDCKSYLDAFLKAQTDFSDACGNAQISGDCAEKLEHCDSKDSDSSGDAKSSGGSGQLLDVDASIGKYKKCPAKANADLDKYIKQQKEQEEKVKKLEDELPDLNEKRDKVESDKNEKLQELTEQQGSDQKDEAAALKAASRAKDEATKAIQNQVIGIQTQISGAKDALQKQELMKMQYQLQMKQTKTQADLNCYQQVSDQIAKMQTDVLAAQTAGTYNRGGFSNLMHSVGVSDRAAWQRISQKYYNWCLQDKKTMETKLAANDGFNAAIQGANQQENTIKDQIGQLQTQQSTLVDNKACGGAQPQANGTSGGESAMCQAARQSQEDSNQAQIDYDTKQAVAKQKAQQIMMKAAAATKTLDTQIAKKNADITAEKHRLENLNDFLQAKYDYGASSNTDGNAVEKASQKLTQLKADGDAVLSCHTTDAKLPPGATDYCDSDPGCRNTRTYMTGTLHVKAVDLPDTSIKKTEAADDVTAAKTAAPPAPAPADASGDAGH